METSSIEKTPENGKTSEYMGMIRLSPDMWFVIAAISQLERELIVERVKNGLKNAKAKEAMDDRF